MRLNRFVFDPLLYLNPDKHQIENTFIPKPSIFHFLSRVGMNNRHFLESIFLLFFEKKITEKDKLKSVDYLCLPTYYATE
jgi:hypothetical protein